ncbi:MAG: hypothetical protein PF689_10300 [Deltaproteobacteria bacterium]|jgi:hypothetical protein|nr:hypothetical protein [Deltaproteobacteria bacterium]
MYRILICLFITVFLAHGCSPSGKSTNDPEICDNEKDDDGDGDSDCADLECCSESYCADKPWCESSDVEICDNGIDDDGDENTDCNDIDCSDHENCQNNEICDNFIDDDMDGMVDCEDPECNESEPCLEICDNEIDDDGNEMIDCDDPDCIDFLACQDEICNNDIDDNGNDLVDCDDPECEESQYCAVELCQNEADENLNGLLDCLDPMCFENNWCGDCNPYNNEGCEQGEYCYIDKNQGTLPRCFASSGTAAEDENCTDAQDCAPGFYCTNSGSSSVCKLICYPGVEDSCPADAPCTSFQEWGQFSAYGMCWPY